MTAGGGGGTTMFGGGIVMGPGGTLTGAPPVAQRAVALHDDVASVPILIERIDPAKPTVAKPIPHDAYRTVSVTDNSTELAAERARRESEGRHEVHLAKEPAFADASVRASGRQGERRGAGAARPRACLARSLRLDRDALPAQVGAAGARRYHAFSRTPRSSSTRRPICTTSSAELGAYGSAPRPADARRAGRCGESCRWRVDLGARGLQQLVQAHEEFRTRRQGRPHAASVATPRVGALALKQRCARARHAGRCGGANTGGAVRAEVARKKAVQLHLLQQERLIDALKPARLTAPAAVALPLREAGRTEHALGRAQRGARGVKTARAAAELELESTSCRRAVDVAKAERGAAVIAQAVAQAANGTIEHENEKLILSEKLRQVLDEQARAPSVSADGPQDHEQRDDTDDGQLMMMMTTTRATGGGGRE